MNIFKNSFKTQAILNLKEFLVSSKNWLFLSKTNNESSLSDTILEDIKTKTELLSLYKLKTGDVECVVKRNDWSINTIYKEYSDTDNLNPMDYYVTTTYSDMLKVWICVDNNNNEPSSYAPNCVDIAGNDPTSVGLCLLTDGYVWKLIYSISNYTSNNFVTSEYFPINNSYVNTSISQEILKIDITGNTFIDWNIPRLGQNYSNYKISSVDTDNTTIYLTNNTVNGGFNTVSDYYKDWNLVLRDNVVQQVRHVLTVKNSNYVSSGLVSVEICETVPSDINGYIYSLVPGVRIDSDGTNFKAYSVVNSSTKTISGVNIFSNGEGNNNLSLSISGLSNNYTVKPLFSIKKSLAFSPINTLKCSELMIYKNISATSINSYDKEKPEVTTISSLGYDNTEIRQFGIIYNEPNNTIYFNPNNPEKLRACTLLYDDSWVQTNTFSCDIDDYVCSLDSNNNILAYGQIVSISVANNSSTGIVIAILPLFGTFSSQFPTLKKLISKFPQVTESLTPVFNINRIINPDYIKQSGRLMYLENIEPFQINTNTSLNTRVIISL